MLVFRTEWLYLANQMEQVDTNIDVSKLFPKLHIELIDLLESLTKEDWEKATIARLWNVKDVASHILDGNIRALSIQRDGFYGETPPQTNSYQDTVKWLNHLNAVWIEAYKRVSPQALIDLLKSTGPLVNEYFAALPPFETAVFPVAWAGHEKSPNWLHVAREYTERWLHQQQIRDAVDKPGILTQELFHPFIDTFMCGLPKAYENVIAKEGTTIQITIDTEVGGTWFLERQNSHWQLTINSDHAAVHIIIPPDVAWKLFSKGINPVIARSHVNIEGNEKLGLHALNMVSVMA